MIDNRGECLGVFITWMTWGGGEALPESLSPGLNAAQPLPRGQPLKQFIASGVNVLDDPIRSGPAPANVDAFEVRRCSPGDPLSTRDQCLQSCFERYSSYSRW